MRVPMLRWSFVLVMSVTAVAGAQPIPDGCKTSAVVTNAYKSGVSQGISLVQRAWANVNNCDRLETFTDIVNQNVANYTLTGTSAYNLCRYTGMVDGVFQQLDNVWKLCDGQCCSEGSAIGVLAAQLYCQLSILLGGLAKPDTYVRRPVLLCGFSFQMCCDADFLGTSLSYVGKDMFGAPQKCEKYTEGDVYTPIWDGTRILQCAYTPPSPANDPNVP